ncbi:hypothetical protein OL548_06160 [Lysinibacillus sp. MHQ-1]|nr:hypothetical protein OL548_06160 [Lysinibacillus sp. MHQ-1]
MTTVPLGLLFELPIVALFLSAIGVLSAESMRKNTGMVLYRNGYMLRCHYTARLY